MSLFPEKTASLTISTFSGTADKATHFYGSIVDEESLGRFTVKQPLTIEMAKEFDIKDQTGGVYQDAIKSGHRPMTERFNSRMSLIARSKDIAQELGFKYLIVKDAGIPALGEVLLAPKGVNIYIINDLVYQSKTIDYDTLYYKILLQKYILMLKNVRK